MLQQVGLVEIFRKSFAKRVKLQKLQRFRARSTIIVSRVGIADKKGIILNLRLFSTFNFQFWKITPL